MKFSVRSRSFLARPTLCAVALTLFSGLALAADSPDLEVLHQIKKEAFEKSQVMETLFQLTEVHGPRLTNSPGIDGAEAWVVEQSNAWGLENAAIEPWGEFGRGWSTSRFSAHLIEPQYAPLIGVPLAFTPGTGGVITDTPLFAPYRRKDSHEARIAELDRFMKEWKGKLNGRIVLLTEPEPLTLETKPAATRLDGSDLSSKTEASDPVEPISIDPENIEYPENSYDQKRFRAHAPSWAYRVLREKRRELRNQLNEFLVEEGVALVVRPPYKGTGGTVFPSGAGSERLEDAVPPPSISLATEHYNRLVRLVQHGVPTTLEVEVQAELQTDDLEGANVVAEIRGKTKPNEVVIIGAHLDDEGYATGTTDNATGCAVMMEVMRILKSLDLPLDRTVRMVLWSGEEQGLRGSRGYVREHFGDVRTMELKPEHGKVSAYYNLDNGGGRIRGIYLQGNDMARPVFSSWFGQFRDHGASTVTLQDTGSTDHAAFDAIGIPGFQFIQDPMEYNTRTHHSNLDLYDRAVPADLMISSAIVATIVYETANRDEMIPRKPLPEPWPANLQDLED
ncbi:MAG: M20/M25/M40 family metallo-hydrolase [Thermoanaerobaculia bacterium]|nr:M20/M25/M40 family metallo-hydrolase [Thermoanaerobaculia bacterium]